MRSAVSFLHPAGGGGVIFRYGLLWDGMELERQRLARVCVRLGNSVETRCHADIIARDRPRAVSLETLSGLDRLKSFKSLIHKQTFFVWIGPITMG